MSSPSVEGVGRRVARKTWRVVHGSRFATTCLAAQRPDESLRRPKKIRNYNKKLLVTKDIGTRSKKLLVAPDLTTSSKDPTRWRPSLLGWRPLLFLEGRPCSSREG